MTKLPDLKEIFSTSGQLARILPGYTFRPQQHEMSEWVYRGLTQGRHVLVEAGTGTGKTLAYLAPAILSRRKVVISTGTKALQEQLFYKDIPLIREALTFSFQAAYMKGRSNYLCKNRFHEFRAFPLFDDPDEARIFKAIQVWAAKTKTGDVAELSELGEHSPLWRRINSGPETCMGGKCPDLEKCFITAMRRNAVKADLVIVNHHLFFADLSVKEKGYGEVIPEYDAVIFDEAHMIEEVATKHFGLQISSYRIGELVRDTRQGMKGLKKREKEVQLLEKSCGRIEEQSRLLFSDLLSGPDRIRLLHGEKMFDELAAKGTELIRLLMLFEQRLKGISVEGEILASCVRRGSEISADLQVIMGAEDPDKVYWYETRGRGVFLHATPIDVSDALQTVLFSRVPGVILTSATLTAGGSFEFIKKRLGLFEVEECSLPSPFDFASQALLYLPRMKSDPNGADFDREAAAHILEILEKTSGRAFVLFTSYRHLHGVYTHLDGKIDYPLLKQGDASREALLTRFKEKTHSVLLATRSFWQGIDVQGEALSCVIIDKLPFASPSDPVVSARIDAIRKRGGNPFLEYQIPEAALSLKQGFGRLIRDASDRGVLSILDKRIRTRAYGKFFLRSLPPCPVTHDVNAIEGVFQPPVKSASHSG